MSEESVWERLGVPYVVPFEELNKLNLRLNQVQVELLTTIEALSSRLARIEGKMTILEINATKVTKEEKSDNVYDFVSREDLGIVEDEVLPVDEVEIDTSDIIYVKSGFAVGLDEDIVSDVGIDDDSEAEEFGGPDNWALNIVKDVQSNGGSINQYWKRFDLIPKEMTPDERSSMLAFLKQSRITEGISKYNVNRMRHFYYYGTPEEGEEKYNAFIN